MQGVSSSAIRAVGHAGERLDVEFNSGSKYRYYGVSKRTATNLQNADSVGGHFNRNIKPKYPYTKLRGAAKKRKR